MNLKNLVKKMIYGGVAVGFLSIAPPAHADLYSQLEISVKWAIFHEGCQAYAGNTRVAPADMKACVIAKQGHNEGAKQITSAASDAEITKAVDQALNEIPAEFQTNVNFAWVMNHEGYLNSFRQSKANKQFSAIRQAYYYAQAHNPNARNLLAAYSDDQIASIIP